MRSLFAMVLLVLTLAFPGAALAGDTHAGWKAKPDAMDLQRFYPERAQRRNVNGSARIECGLSPESVLHDCQVLSETPPGMGFGEAAQRTTALFQMAPATHDGRPIESSVIIPVRFALPEPTPLDWSRITADLIGLAFELAVLLLMGFHWRDIARALDAGSIRTVTGADRTRASHPARYRLWAAVWLLAATVFSLIFVLLALRQLLDICRLALA